MDTHSSPERWRRGALHPLCLAFGMGHSTLAERGLSIEPAGLWSAVGGPVSAVPSLVNPAVSVQKRNSGNPSLRAPTWTWKMGQWAALDAHAHLPCQ